VRETAEVPIGVGFLNETVGESVSCTLRIRVPVIAGIWVVPRAFVPLCDEGFFFLGLCPKPWQGNVSPAPPFAETCTCFCGIRFQGDDPLWWEFEGETLKKERRKQNEG